MHPTNCKTAKKWPIGIRKNHGFLRKQPSCRNGFHHHAIASEAKTGDAWLPWQLDRRSEIPTPETSVTKFKDVGKNPWKNHQVKYVAVCKTLINTLCCHLCHFSKSDPITHPIIPRKKPDLCPSGTIPRHFDLQRPYLSTARALGTQTFDETLALSV